MTSLFPYYEKVQPIDALMALHRATDRAFVRFGYLRNKAFKSLRDAGVRGGSCSVPDLPGLESTLTNGPPHVDFYFGINSHYRPATHQDAHVQWLNAVWADVDCGKHKTLGYWQALESIYGAISREIIPPVSMISHAGDRAIFLFWILRDQDDPRLPVIAHDSTRAMHKAVMLAIVNRLNAFCPALKADPKSTNPGRITRLPGSWHSEAKRQVECTINYINGEPYRYTLPQLAKFFDVPIRERRRLKIYVKNKSNPRWPTPNENPVPGRRRGRVAKLKMMRSDLEKIELDRGGFSGGNRTGEKGCRFFAIKYMTAILLGLEIERPAITQTAKQWAMRCKPEYQEVDKAIAMGWGWLIGTETNRQIARNLNVTIDEANRLGLQQIRPDFEPRKYVAKGRESKAEDRRRIIQQMLTSMPPGKRPNRRGIERQLIVNYPQFAASRRTIAADLAKLRIK